MGRIKHNLGKPIKNTGIHPKNMKNFEKSQFLCQRLQ
jgi:hypothetical protein